MIQLLPFCLPAADLLNLLYCIFHHRLQQTIYLLDIRREDILPDSAYIQLFLSPLVMRILSVVLKVPPHGRNLLHVNTGWLHGTGLVDLMKSRFTDAS